MKEEKGSNYNEIWVLLAFLLLGIVLFFISRKVYWNWKSKQGKKETEKLREEMREWWIKKHDRHTKLGIKKHEHCEVCKGLWN